MTDFGDMVNINNISSSYIDPVALKRVTERLQGMIDIQRSTIWRLEDNFHSEISLMEQESSRLRGRIFVLECIVSVLVSSLCLLIFFPLVWVLIAAVSVFLILAITPWERARDTMTHWSTWVVDEVREAIEFYRPGAHE